MDEIIKIITKLKNENSELKKEMNEMKIKWI